MSSEGKYFLRGIARIILAMIALAFVVVVFNMIGYLFVQSGLYYIQGDSYLARALKLACIGFLNVAAVCVVVVLAYNLLPKASRVIFSAIAAILSKTYHAISYIGGYREREEKTDDV
ncbi:hypothetical protein [Pseudomonas chlororaphis]|uniref:hypothetical protein n=1 Tax=Pseudomonas chlororaphis TaxID=587753 RepID=UPI002407E1F9|nr:hypothetical protein [Pseudomonas chlororaphis]